MRINYDLFKGLTFKRRELFFCYTSARSSSVQKRSSRDLLWRRGGFRTEGLKRKKSVGISWKDNSGGLEEREEG
jgi:hypothetical protein